MLSIYLILGIICFNYSSCEESFKVVNLEQGPVKGYRNKDYPIFEFYGIPYATEPKGSDKFGPPLPEPEWKEPLKAVDKNIACKQSRLPIISLEFGDNCLIANVFTPDVEAKNLPVLVVIHGGAFQLFSGNFVAPHRLASQGRFVVVTFNYRLGVNGFLCLGTEKIPGNAGLKDQLALLKWVQKNIARFGGNPDDVTLSGFSAGSSSVEFHMLSKHSKGLFHKAILESGSSMATWSMQIDPTAEAENFARKLGYTGSSLAELERFYLTATDDQLNTISLIPNKNSSVTFTPCVEKDVENAFITEPPHKTFKSKNFQQVPVLTGLNNKEGKIKFYLYPLWRALMKSNLEEFISQDLAFINEEDKKAVADRIKEIYFGKDPEAEVTQDMFVDYFSDTMFTYPIFQAVKSLVESGNKDVYFYEYTYVPDVDHPAVSLTKSVTGADHCAQSMAIYDYHKLGLSYSTLPKKVMDMYDTIRKLWINFIKTGKPVPDKTPFYPEGWPAVASDGSPRMVIGDTIQLSKQPYLPDIMGFWDSIYKNHQNLPQSPSDKNK